MEPVIPDKQVLEDSILMCNRNGKDLLNDAVLLFEMDRFSTSFAVAVLAQEEFAKGFLLHLVADDALPWIDEVRQSINRHECKHLFAMVLDWLPSWDDEFSYDRHEERRTRRNKIWADYNAEKISRDELLSALDAERDALRFGPDIASALNIYRHEEIERLGRRLPWRDEEWKHGRARKLADGLLDKKKQSALYVRIGKSGHVTSHPGQITMRDAEEEIAKAKSLAEMRMFFSDEYQFLKDSTIAVFANLKLKSPSN